MNMVSPCARSIAAPQFMRQIQIERGSRTETVVCRVSPADLALFDEKLKEAGVRNRSEALRNVIRNVGGIAAPDAELAEALHAMKAALNRVGNNVSQIAKRMNDAKNRGSVAPVQRNGPRGDPAPGRNGARLCGRGCAHG